MSRCRCRRFVTVNGAGAHFHSGLLPPYLKRARSAEELIPWLNLKGVSTGDYQVALSVLLGDGVNGLSANLISRLKQHWSEEHRVWCRRELSDRGWVYWWGDGVYSNVRMDERVCLLVIIGVTRHGLRPHSAARAPRGGDQRRWAHA